MSMWSDREEFYAKQRKEEELKRLGNLIREYPEGYLRNRIVEAYQKLGIDTYTALELTEKRMGDW